MKAHPGAPTDVPSVLRRVSRPKRAVVTAGMPYANGPLHLGHLAGAHLPADIFARWLGLLIGRREQLTNDQFALLGSGFAGGFTTFSTFAVAVAESLEDGRIMVVSVTEGAGISYDCLLIFAAQAILTFVVGYAFFLRSKGRFADEV